MPGRLRTASSPSSTWISEAPYSCSVWVVFISFNSVRSSAMMFLRLVMRLIYSNPFRPARAHSAAGERGVR